MKNFFRTFLATLLGVAIIGIAQTLPAGFPSSAGSSSSGSGSNYWVDAGSGYMNATATIKLLPDPSATIQQFSYVQPTSGYGIIPGGNVMVSDLAAGRVSSVATTWLGNATPATQYGLFYSNFSGNNGSSPDWGVGLNLGSITNGTSVHLLSAGTRYAEFHPTATTVGVGYTPVLGGLSMYTSAGSKAIELQTGAYLDFGGGTSDYGLSDGTGISTPNYWASTRAFSTGDGIIASRVRASGNADTEFKSANVSAGAAGSMALNTTFGRMMVQTSASTFAPIGQPHLTYDKQTITTRILSISGVTAVPEIAERIATDNSGNTVKAYWGGTGTGAIASVLTSLDRTYYAVQPGTEANSRYFGTTQDSAALGTVKPIVTARQSPGWCQPIRTGASIANIRIWAGLVSTGTSTGTSTMNGDGVMFRYDATVDGLLYVCSRDGTTQSCTSTGITMATSTTYHLCFQLDSSRNIYAWVNGVHVVNKTTNLPSINATLAPWVEIQTTAGDGAKVLAAGVMQVESL